MNIILCILIFGIILNIITSIYATYVDLNAGKDHTIKDVLLVFLFTCIPYVTFLAVLEELQILNKVILKGKTK